MTYVFMVCAVAGGTVLLCQLALTLLGIGSDWSADSFHDGADAHDIGGGLGADGQFEGDGSGAGGGEPDGDRGEGRGDRDECGSQPAQAVKPRPSRTRSRAERMPRARHTGVVSGGWTAGYSGRDPTRTTSRE